MNKLSIFLFLILSSPLSYVFAQADSVYYKDIYLSKKCTASKANYVSFITTIGNGQTIHEIKQIKGGITLQKEFNTGEPIGIWHYRKHKILDYDFNLNYTDTSCDDGILIVDKPFYNNFTTNYHAPTIDIQYKNIEDFLSKNITYPVYARENGISGKVIVHFVITSTGEIQNIAVISSGDFSLDKEAMRIFRSLKLTSPPIVNEKPVSICTSMPVNFEIDN